MESLMKVWFYSDEISRFFKTFIESMSASIRALKVYKGGQTKY